MVEHTTNEGTPLQVQWYHRATPDDIPQIVSGGNNSIQSLSTCGFVESELTLSLADVTVGSLGRYFFCRVSFFNGTIIDNSQEVKLLPESSIGSSLPACGMNGTRSVQSALLRQCIDPIPPQPKPTTTQSIAKVPSSTPLHTPMTSTSTLLPLPTTSTSTLLPSATPEASDPGANSTNAPNITSDPETTDTNTPNTTDNDGNNQGASDTNQQEILIYAVVGVAVFLFLVIAVLVVCVCMWNRFDTVLHHPTR